MKFLCILNFFPPLVVKINAREGFFKIFFFVIGKIMNLLINTLEQSCILNYY